MRPQDPEKSQFPQFSSMSAVVALVVAKRLHDNEKARCKHTQRKETFIPQEQEWKKPQPYTRAHEGKISEYIKELVRNGAESQSCRHEYDELREPKWPLLHFFGRQRSAALEGTTGRTFSKDSLASAVQTASWRPSLSKTNSACHGVNS